MKKQARGKSALATFCVGIGGSGAGAEAGAHDAQLFACEARLLLQLTLCAEREGERNAGKIFMAVTAGNRRLLVQMRHCTLKERLQE